MTPKRDYLMINPTKLVKTPIPLRWVVADLLLICVAGTMILGISNQKNVIGESRPPISSQRVGTPRSGVAMISRIVSPIPPDVADRYGRLPLAFEPNFGQSNGPAKFLSRGDGYTLFLTTTEAVFALSKPASEKTTLENKVSFPVQAGKANRFSFGNTSQFAGILRMSLVGANPATYFSGLDELPGKSNYFIGNQPANWHTNIPNYRKVARHEVYRGIDLIYYGTHRQLEYDFVVSPGADPHTIQLRFRGARNLRTNSQGELVASMDGGEVRLQKPIAYQETSGLRHPVTAKFVMKGARTVVFQVGKYDPRMSLVIDPILSYSTYLGGSNVDFSNSIAVASDGTAFIAGGTLSSDFPTAHALQPNAGGPNDFPKDAFVAKLSADGSTLLYSTYLGGSEQDVANGIAVDDAGDAYVTGTTLSPDFPATPGSFNTLCGGDGKCGATFNPNGLVVENGFITKLNPAGSAIDYSGFIGEYENVSCQSIAVDPNQIAYVTGSVEANGMPTVTITPPATPPPPFPGAPPGTLGFRQTFGGGATDAFVVKISKTGTTILYWSYLGGSNEDIGYGIAADGAADAYVTGLTYSSDFPVLNSVQTTYGGAGDAFFSKLSTTASGASSLLYSTYIGGSGLDQGNGVVVDSSGNGYVVGITNSVASSLGFTPPAGAVQPNCDVPPSPAPPPVPSTCQGDAFVGKLNPSQVGAASIVYFTYLGGTLADEGAGIAVDSSGNAYIVGSTVSRDFPTTMPVFQPTYGGGNADAFVTKLDPAGSALLYSTYLGGSNTESGNGIAVDTSGSAYVTGQTCSLDFPLSNPFQGAPGGNCDAFVSKIVVSTAGISLSPAGLIFQGQPVGSMSTAQTVTLNNGDSVLSISSVAITGTNGADFAQTNSCGTSVVPGGSCTFSVTFAPTAAGTRTASLTITDSAPGSPHLVNLTGTGNPSPQVNLLPSSLSFGNQSVGTTSNPQPITVTNTGNAALTFTSIVASGAFAQTNDCTALLQPTTNCVINVTFAPTAAGSSTGALTLTDNAPNSPQILLLTGTGLQEPVVMLSTTSIGFPNQPVGTTSAPLQVTLSNTGSASLSITAIVATGDFSQSNTCPSTLPINANCAITVVFSPTAASVRTGTITISDNAPTSPQVVNLNGTGTPSPAISFSPTSLSFESQTVGTTSAPQAVTVTNTGSAPLTITSIAASGSFTETNNCTAPLQPTTNCVISVTFTPLTAGSSTGALTLVDNAPGSPQVVLLSGTGVGQAAPNFSLAASPTSATVSAGQSASFALTITPINGFSQQITLSCSGTPAASNCFASQNPLTPSSTAPTTVMVTVSTGLRTLAPPASRLKVDPMGALKRIGLPWLAWLIVLLALATVGIRRGQRRTKTVLGLAFGLALLLTSCGGGNLANTPPGTPAGTYQITVAATSGSITHTTTLTLNVN